MRKWLTALLTAAMLLAAAPPVRAAGPDIAAPSAILMDAATGTVLYEKNASERLRPASVTKVMTLLLVMEALDTGRIGWNDTVIASEAACAKGGSQVYLEPGEAWALNAGYLVTTVLDTLQNGDTSLAVLDMSAACHTPDVIEMPYRPPLLDAGEPGEKPCTIRLGGPTCLAGDVVGDYSFDAPLAEGDRLIFGDMAIYTTCKNNTFNGMPLPPIWAMDENGTCRELVKFGYSDFKMRLGRAAG